MSKPGKTYSKRGSAVPVASIQFDKVITDGAKRPSASKSAGVVGKWGTTSFTSLRSSQVNGSKTGNKKGMSPAKPSSVLDYGVSTLEPAARNRMLDTFSFEPTSAKSGPVDLPAQPKPRKFFKSRAADDTSKSSPAVPSSSLVPNLATGHPLPITPVENYTSSNVGYLSPTYSTSPTSKSQAKRGRGRPRGSRTTSPKSTTSAVTAKAPAGRGAPRGRRRGKANRTVRGQQGSGRGKRKRAHWEQSESEEDEDAASPDVDEQEDVLDANTNDDEDDVQEDDNDEHEPMEEDQNGTIHCRLEEEHKPPIKLRIIRRNDTNAFVSKVGAETSDAQTAEPHPEPNPEPNPVAVQEQAPFPPLSDEPCSNVTKTKPTDESDSPPFEARNSSTAVEVSPFQSDVNPAQTRESPPIEFPAPSTVPETVVENIPSAPQTTLHRQQKKSSIFKSRFNSSQPAAESIAPAKGETALSKSKKGLALYRHKWNEAADTSSVSNAPVSSGSHANSAPENQERSQPSPWDDLDDEAECHPPKLSRVGSSASSSAVSKSAQLDEDDDVGATETGIGGLRVARKVKDYYTVVRNVKKAHQIQESGEFQEFNDDVDYILDALQSRNPTATRCLSAMSLASKCMEPAFRMHLRAHSTVAKFFQALKDAPAKASVALCTSCIMFVLTQDRLNMDLDRDSLELMLNLLEIDGGQVDALEGKELEKNKLKVRELCEEMVRKGHAPHLNLDKITAAQLAMETLLSLTSKKAGEWFKEELRVLGGLDHIIQTVTVCTTTLTPSDVLSWEWDKSRLDALKKVDRCLRVLENVTFQNEENQAYLMEYSSGLLVDATLQLLRMLSREVAAYSQPVAKDSLAHILGETLSNLMKVVMNLTHDSNDDAIGSKVYGDKPLTWETTLVCLLHTTPCLPEEKSFDVMTLALGILINLVERSSVNRDRLMVAVVPSKNDDIFYSKPTAVRALIDLFINKEESARLEEARTDAILDGKSQHDSTSQCASSGTSETPTVPSGGKAQEDAMEETVKKLLHKAGRHMEDSMVAAYVALLLGYIVMKNEDYERQVKDLLPERKFTQMIVVLKKFYEFLKLTANAVTSTRGLKNTQMVIKFMESSDRA